jgi:hypothetical protein
VIGAFLIVAGTLLTWRPLLMARMVNQLRFVPFASERVPEYRVAGACIAAIGGILAIAGATI